MTAILLLFIGAHLTKYFDECMTAFRLENPKWDQNLLFTPLNLKTSIPDLSIGELPTPCPRDRITHNTQQPLKLSFDFINHLLYSDIQ